MRTAFFLILAFVMTLFLLSLTGCITTTTTAKDGTVTVTKTPAPGVLPFAGAVLEAYSPRDIRVREEKTGRITRQEIERRWKP